MFRTDAGSKLRGLDRSPSVCFEADGIDVHELTGWSVLVKGRAVELHGIDELRHAAELPLRFWAMGDKAHWIRIKPSEVTGRRILKIDGREAPSGVAQPGQCRFEMETASDRGSGTKRLVLPVTGLRSPSHSLSRGLSPSAWLPARRKVVPGRTP